MSLAQAEMPYRVPYADTDQMGVVYYANFFIYFERFRNELLRELGYTYKNMEADGIQLPVIEAHCEYRQPAHYDDLLLVRGWLAESRGARVRVVCEVLRQEDLLAVGHTVHVCWDRQRGKPVRLPAALRSRVAAGDAH